MKEKISKWFHDHAIGVAWIFFLIVLFVYSFKFYISGSSTQETWGQFGDFMGGIVNPFIGLVTIMFLSITLKQNEELLSQSREELRITREELKKGQEIQKATEEALNEQIKVSVYGRDLNNALALYENLERRAESLLSHNPAWKYDERSLQADINAHKLSKNVPAKQYEEAIKLKVELNHILDAEHERLLKLYPKD